MDGSVITVSGEGGVTNGCRYQKDFLTRFLPVNVLVLFDRSSSMTRAISTSTRFEIASNFLANLVGTYSTKVRWGYADFPGENGCSEWPIPGCCVSGPSIGLSATNAEAVQLAIRMATPRTGSSPLALALELTRQYYEALEDDGSARFVLLATDGDPSCTLTSELSPSVVNSSAGNLLPSPCYDALASITRLVSQGVRVIVLSVGPEESENPDGRLGCLDFLAKNGNTSIAPDTPSYFTISTSDQIEQVIEQALGAGDRPSCTFDLVDRPSTLEGAQVVIDGEEIPYGSEDGWILASTGRPVQLQILGEACERIRHFQVQSLEMRYACSMCLESVCP